MPLTPERQREILAQRGLNPDEYEVVPLSQMQGAGPQTNPIGTKDEPTPPVAQQPSVMQPPVIGAGESFRRAATESAAPTLAAVLAGGALTAEGVPLAHAFPPWTELAAGAIGAGVAGWGAHKLQKAVVPQKIQDKLFVTPESAAQNPKSTYVGNLAPSLLAFNPLKGAANLAQLGKEATLLPTLGRSAISQESMKTIMNAGPMAGLSAGQNIYEQSKSKEPFSFGSLAADVAPAMLLNAPTSLGRKLMFQGPEQPTGHESAMQELQAKRDAITAEKEAQLKAEKEAPAPVSVEEAVKEPQKKFTKQEDELQRLAAENAGIPEDKFSTTPTMSPEERATTRESIKPAATEVATRRGYQTEEVPKITDAKGEPQAASLNYGTRDIKLSTDETTGASGGSTSHELIHGFGRDLVNSSAPRDNEHITKAFQAVMGDKTVTHAQVKEQMNKPTSEQDPRFAKAEEDLAKLGEKGGYQQLKTDLYGTRRQKIVQYAREVANHVRVKFGREVTPENMADFLHSRIRGDAPYGERPELLPAKGVAAPATQTSDDTRHSEEPVSQLKDAPVKYRGYQEGIGRFPSKHLYDLTEHLSPTLVKDSTVTHKQLADEGYKVPDALRAAHEGGEDTKHSTQPVPLNNKNLFVTNTEKELSREKPFNLTASPNGNVSKQSLVARLESRVPADELAALNDAGLQEHLSKGGDKVHVGELKRWIQENGPKVEVRKAGIGQDKTSALRNEALTIQHDLDTWGYTKEYETADYWMKNGNKIKIEDQPKKIQDNIKRWEELRNIVTKEPYGQDSNWQSIAPKPESEMPGYVEIAITRPVGKNAKLNMHTDTEEGSHYTSVNKFESSHNFPPNTVGWVRGYMDGDTFRIIEVQSDWATKVKKIKAENAQQLKEIQEGSRLGSYIERGKQIDDPTLNYYESLALKAAIKHAHEQGAKHIAVDDSQTAMLTEGHDKYIKLTRAVNGKDLYSKELQALSEARAITKYATPKSPDGELVGSGKYHLEPNDKGAFNVVIDKPPFIAGMQNHYDTSLKEIVSKLTGSEGSLKEFGEHKMAVVNPENVNHADMLAQQEGSMDRPRLGSPRKDLIFKNPDGTPKTTSTARSFSLEGVTARLDKNEPFGTFSGSRYSKEPVPLGDTEQVGDNTKKGFLRSIEAAFDKVGRHDTKVSQALHNYAAQKTENEGHFVNVPETELKALKPTDRELENVSLYRRSKFREYDDTGKAPKALTPKEQKLNDVFQSEVSDAVRQKQNDLGLQVEGRNGVLRKGGEDPNYIPDMMNDATKQKLINGSVYEKKAIINEMVAYGKKHSNLGEEVLKKKVHDYVNVLGRRSGGSLSQAEFNALRLPEGLGLPANMRETNLLTITRKYGKRAANDLAYFEHLQKPARIAAALGLKDQEGKLVTMPGVESIANIPDVQNAMTRVTGNFSTVHQPRVMSVSRAVVNSMLQTATGLRDMATIPNNAAPYLHKFSDVTAAFKAMGNLKDATLQSLKYGARSQTLDADRWHALSNPDQVTDVANKVAEAMRKYSGRDLIEQGSRIFTYAWGKELAKLNIMRAMKGDKASKAWLEKFGTLVEDPTKATDETLNRIAKNFVDRNQGTYDGRGLPTGIDEGPLAPFMSLSRWGVEKSNVIYKDVVQPLKEGNYKPFLAYTLGSVLTGAAIKQLNQFMSGKKEQNASLEESLVAGNKTEAAAAIVNLLQLGSYAGFMSDVAKMGTDVFVHHQKPSTLNFPLMSFATDTVGQGLADWSTAVEQGEDPVHASVALAYQILKGSIQDVRLADQRLGNTEDTEKKNKYRDLRVFKTLYDYPVPQPTFGHDNTLMGEDTKKFKKTDDMGEAAALVPNLLGKALETSKNADGTVNIDKLKSKVAGLKGNSYQTIPSPEESPQEFVQYMGFLRETQGDEAARSRLVDYMVQRAKNQAKSGMVPSL